MVREVPVYRGLAAQFRPPPPSPGKKSHYLELLSSSVLFAVVFKDYIDTGLVPRFPSLIAAVGAIAIAAQLWVTGMILERVRLNRNILLQTNYRVWLLNQK
jgi:hypothetical protein